jgi:CRISPR system Cascade subunit CasB
MADEPRWNERAFRWWRELQPNDGHPDPTQRSGNRAALARLRRCARVAEAASEPEALDLARRVGVTHAQHTRLEDALLAAIILAQVREDDRGAPVARQLGASGPEQRAVMSPLRFSRLLTADTIEDRLIAFRRVVALLGGRAHVPNLATALLDWSERTRIIWAFDYHNVPPPGTADFTTPTPEAGDAR